MDKRNPCTILDIAPGTEWPVIEAAYRMLVSQVSGPGNTEKQSGVLAEIEWAYKELKDPKRRLKHYRKYMKVPSGEDNSPSSSGSDEITDTRTRWKTTISVVVSTVLFCGMLGAIGYGLYVVGAVPPEIGSGVPIDHASDIGVAATPTNRAKEMDNETVQIGHTATVESLRTTATSEALVDQKAGLTATVEMAQLALTPTPVQLRACPNVASVNVRTGSGTGYRAIGYILEGDCVNAIGRNGAGDWLVIGDAPRPSSDGGWVSASLMTIEGDMESLAEVEDE